RDAAVAASRRRRTGRVLPLYRSRRGPAAGLSLQPVATRVYGRATRSRPVRARWWRRQPRAAALLPRHDVPPAAQSRARRLAPRARYGHPGRALPVGADRRPGGRSRLPRPVVSRAGDRAAPDPLPAGGAQRLDATGPARP